LIPESTRGTLNEGLLSGGFVMREHEMRERIERLIRRAAVPAGVGISMALAGCGGEVVGSTAKSDPTPPVQPRTDAAADPAPPMMDASVVPVPDNSMYMAPMPLYMAVMPDSGMKPPPVVDASAADAGTNDANTLDIHVQPTPLYGGPFTLYMAIMPDGGGLDNAG
jgi:hypothetical protein